VGYTRQLRVQPNVALNGITPEGTYLKGMSVSPVASICQPGAPVRLTARGLPTDTVFNYRWRVVQGPLAVLAGAQTAEVGLWCCSWRPVRCLSLPRTRLCTWPERWSMSIQRTPLNPAVFKQISKIDEVICWQ
jgi:hypothetical protein